MNDQRRTERRLAEDLEMAVDAAGLGSVLEMLAEICSGKAEHLRTNWQDKVQAREWERNARYLEQAARKVVF